MEISDLTDLFPDSVALDPVAPPPTPPLPFDSIPAKMAVYLLTDSADQPLLLSTVGNLRATLQRRFAEIPADQKSKRIQYAQITHRLHYRIVHSPFVANLWYMRAAKSLFPGRYREFITFPRPSFITLNLHDAFPRLRRTEAIDDPAALYAGPIPERRAADKLIETLEDLFDLCRYHDILRQAPHGKPCAYKEMGKCPAPCDGSISLDQYRVQLSAAFEFLTHSQQWTAATESAMRTAAAKLEFETAAKIKQRLTRAEILQHPQYTHLDTLNHLTYLILQPGLGRNRIEPLLLHGPTLHLFDPLHKKDLAETLPPLFEKINSLTTTPITPPFTEDNLDTLTLLTHHLSKGPDDAGLYLHLNQIPDPTTLLTAAQELLTRRTPTKPLIEQSSDREPSSITPAPPAADA